MKSLYLYFLSFAALFSICCSVVSTKTTLLKGDIVRESYNSVTYLEAEFTKVDPKKKKSTVTFGITATGFAIDKDHIITAGHFCMSAFEIVTTEKIIKAEFKALFLEHGKETLVSIDGLKMMAVDLDNDLCMVLRPDHGITPVKLSSKKEFKIRDKVYTVGAPASTFPLEAEGHISLPLIEVDKEDSALNNKMLLSLPIYKGNSGSPIFDDQGEVIGVIVMGNPRFEHITYATRLAELKVFIRKILHE